MPTVIIDDKIVVLPARHKGGEALTDDDAYILDLIHVRRIAAKLKRMLSRGEIVEAELVAKAQELHSQDLAPGSSTDDDDADNDPIIIEAMVIARELISARMAKENLPPPKNLDIHAKALVDAMPAIAEKARLRVEARFRIAQEALEAMS